MDQPSFEREVNAYLVNVDGVLKSKGLFNDKGGAKLNNIQREVDMTLDKMRTMQRERHLDRMSAGRISASSISKVTVMADQVNDGSKVPLGSAFGSLATHSIFTVPEWKDAFSKVSVAVSNFTNKYGVLISNMDAMTRQTIDQALASVVDNAQIGFNKDPTATGAARYLSASMASIAALESASRQRQQVSAAGMLEMAVKEKDQQRIRALANMKLVEKSLSSEQITVVNDANRRILEKLEEMLTEQTSYDAAIRNKKLQLVDSDLDIIKRVLENQSFSSKLGRALPPPRNGGTRLGFLNKNIMKQDFRAAPASNLGGGLGVSFKTIELTNRNTSPYDILSVVKHNAGVIKSQGQLSKEDKPEFIRQVNSLTLESFGGDATAFREAKGHYSLLINSGLGGVFKYEESKESLPNWMRLIGSTVLYLGPIAGGLYIVGSRKENKEAALIAEIAGVE